MHDCRCPETFHTLLCRQLQSLLSGDEVSQLHSLCQRCLWHTLQTCVRAHGIGHTTYVGRL